MAAAPNAKFGDFSQAAAEAGGARRYRGRVKITQIWRYPVKSLQGEMLAAATLGREGVSGDRGYAIFDTATGYGLTARRMPELLFAHARLDGETPVVTLPDGSRAEDDAALSDWLGRPVALRATTEVAERQFENVDDFEREMASTWHPFSGSLGSFRDNERAAVSVVSEGTLGQWDRRRFRPSIVVSGSGEDALVGRQARLGDARIEFSERLGRCVMVTRPQPQFAGVAIEKDLDVLRAVHRERAGLLAVGALVVEGGSIAVGDELSTSA